MSQRYRASGCWGTQDVGASWSHMSDSCARLDSNPRRLRCPVMICPHGPVPVLKLKHAFSQNVSHLACQPLLPQLPAYEQAGIVFIGHLGFSVFVFCFVLFYSTTKCKLGHWFLPGFSGFGSCLLTNLRKQPPLLQSRLAQSTLLEESPGRKVHL